MIRILIGAALFSAFVLGLGLIGLAAGGADSLDAYLILATILFGIGMFGFLARRNAISMLMSIELMLNAVNLSIVAFGSFNAKLAATKPRPATTPSRIAVRSPGAGPMIQSNAAAAARLATNAAANTPARCAGGLEGSTPASRHQARRNSGPYQMPPSAKADSAATTIPSQFIVAIAVSTRRATRSDAGRPRSRPPVRPCRH